MDHFRLFYIVVRFVAAALTVAVAASVQAEVSPEFFLDDFEDGTIQDDMPVSWRNHFDWGEIDASSGDLIVTTDAEQNGSWVTVEDYTYDDVSIRTQVAIPSGKPWDKVNVCARGRFDDHSIYCAGINSSTFLAKPSALEIWGAFGPNYPGLCSVHTDLDPAQTDVFLQFDLLGDQLTLTAWAEGTPKQQVACRDLTIQEGMIGLTYWQGPPGGPGLPELTPATYRFFEAAAILPGDFNVNEVLDVEDIDLLTAELTRPVPRYRPQFDLNDDKIVDLADHEIWVHDLKDTWFGDGDLNGEFNTGDLVQVLTAGKYETRRSAGWAEGDWNGDGVFGTGDLVKAFEDGGYEMGPKENVAVVPEPTTVLWLMTGLFGLAVHPERRQRRSVVG